MKKLSLFFILLMMIALYLPATQNQEKQETPETALLIIDIQDFYFPGGGYELVNPEAAALKAKEVLKAFRAKKKTVIHVRHNAKKGADIQKHVTPITNEKVISKDHANSFRDTDLLKYLNEQNIKKLVICGMMTHMCVEAATRAAADYGFQCIVISDACATKDLKFNDKTIPAQQVHLSTLSSLTGFYANVLDTATFLKEF